MSDRESRRVAVYCGSARGSDGMMELARSVGKTLAESGIDVVYGGAHVGMMGALADSVLSSGGEVHGVLPRALTEREIAHTSLTRLHLVDSMHERKALMARLADAFLTLPGGFGTLDELFDVLTHVQIGVSTKRIVLLNIDGYFDALLAFLDHAQAHGLLQPEHRLALTVETHVDRLEAALFGGATGTAVPAVLDARGAVLCWGIRCSRRLLVTCPSPTRSAGTTSCARSPSGARPSPTRSSTSTTAAPTR